MLRAFRFRISFAFLLPLLFSQLPALATDCEGTVEQKHTVQPNFVFFTNSQVFPKDGSGYTKYETCVYNPDPVNDIHVTWFVPGPYDSWVPKTSSTLWPRRQPDGDASPMDGCIRYGNLGEATVAQYFGSVEDQKAESAPFEKDCILKAKGQAAVESPAASTVKLATFTDAFRTYFPSDPLNAHNTMLQLDGTIGIKKISEKEYDTVLTYALSRAEGRLEGSVDGIKIRPHFTGDAEVLLNFYSKLYPPESPIEKYSTIQFPVFGTDNWRLSSGTYEFLDKDDRRLGIVKVPLFIPSRE
jgi:hypothetical protein